MRFCKAVDGVALPAWEGEETDNDDNTDAAAYTCTCEFARSQTWLTKKKNGRKKKKPKDKSELLENDEDFKRFVRSLGKGQTRG